MEAKVCKICTEEKDLTEFRKGRNQCKNCLSNKFKDFHKNYYLSNKEFLLERMKDNYRENIDERTKINKKYRDENKEKLNELSKVWRKENKEKVLQYKKDNKEKLKEYNKLYWEERLKIDPLFRIKVILRKRMSYIFRNKKVSKNSKTEEIIGCTFEEFKIFIESKFESWMTWDNYGKYNGELNYGWDIDHITPLSSVNTEEDIIKLNHYTNLQPLCSHVNRYVKCDKLVW